MSATHVNVIKDANLSEWNQDTDAYNQYGYQKDTFGVSRSHQSYLTQYMRPSQDVMGRWYNGVPLYRLNYGGDYHSGVGSKNGDVRTMQYFSYPVSVSRNRIIMYYI